MSRHVTDAVTRAQKPGPYPLCTAMVESPTRITRTGCAEAHSANAERSIDLRSIVGDFCILAALGQVLALCLTAAQGETVRACAVLDARKSATDTGRIQQALSLCSPGKAVVLRGGAFHSAPLILPRGVTLFVDRGSTLFASKNPRDYDLKPGSCGAPLDGKAPNCKPFLYSYQAAYSGVGGTGVIDGQGESWKT